MNDKQLETLIDRQAIVDLSFRYSRACDRLDRDLLASVYWPDGTDDHGIFQGSAPEFVDWVMGLLGGWISSHHSNTNFLIDIEGNRAVGECHWTGFYTYVLDGTTTDQLAAGRYLDRYERRDGQWRILHRTCTTEWTRSAAAASDWRASPTAITGRRDGTDLIYELERSPTANR